MEKTYRIEHMGSPKLMIGLRVTRTPSSIKLDQSHYILDMIDKFKQADCTPVHSPASVTGCFGSSIDGDSSPLDLTVFPYMPLMGSLLWVTITRADTAAVVSKACSYGSSATRAHWRTAIRILGYLKTTIKLSLTYPKSQRSALVSAFVDAAFANERDHRCRYGFAVFLGGCLVSWVSRCTTMVCLSTAEAEFIAVTEAAKEVMWLRELLNELGLAAAGPTTIFGDNQVCVSMINNYAVSSRSCHFAVKMSWIREMVHNKTITFVFVPSEKYLADTLTEILPEQQFRILRDKLMKGLRSRGEC